MEELKNLLRANAKRLQQKHHYKALLDEKDEKWLDPKGKSYARYILLNISFLNEVWHCGETTYISTGIHEVFAYIKL